MIEFDVLPEDIADPQPTAGSCSRTTTTTTSAAALTLEEGLAHLASSPFTDVELDVDLKLPGYEARVVEALREHGLERRCWCRRTFMRSLVALRALEPRLRLGWSVPRARRDYTPRALWMLPAYAMVARSAAGCRAAAGPPDRRALRRVMAHWRLVSPRLVRAARGRRRAVRVDRRRRAPHPRARGDGRDRRDHERSRACSTAGVPRTCGCARSRPVMKWARVVRSSGRELRDDPSRRTGPHRPRTSSALPRDARRRLRVRRHAAARPRRGRGRDRARLRARVPQAQAATSPRAAASAPGCSASPATPRSTSCAAGSAAAPLATEPADVDAASPRRARGAARRAAVRTALAAPPARDRELIALKFHAGLDNAELRRRARRQRHQRRHAPCTAP